MGSVEIYPDANGNAGDDCPIDVGDDLGGLSHSM